ncbi:hypothetical protein CL628_00025 [bacterium]|nr:hypothetical protein [bacterium]
MREIETIIIGGGVAGLGCARSLSDAGNNNFLVVTKDIVGSIPESKDTNVNLGAYYIQSSYHNFLPYVDIRRRIRLHEGIWLGEEGERAVFDLRNLPHVWVYVRFMLWLRKFHRHHEELKRRTATESLRSALEKDPFLQQLYNQPGAKFVRDHHLEYWSRHFMNQVSRALGFVDVSEITGFIFCLGMLTIVYPMYEFDYQVDRLVRPFKKKILMDEVIRIKRQGDQWQVTSVSGKSFMSRNLVVATPTDTACALLKIEHERNTVARAFSAHLRGTVKANLDGDRYVFLSQRSGDLALARQDDGTFVFYSHRRDYDLSDYFDDYEVISTRAWDPAFYLGSHILDEDRGNNCYVVGGHNITFIENALISGQFAAHKILQQASLQ